VQNGSLQESHGSRSEEQIGLRDVGKEDSNKNPGMVRVANTRVLGASTFARSAHSHLVMAGLISRFRPRHETKPVGHDRINTQEKRGAQASGPQNADP
jgi:hypothetical protein